MSNLFNLRKNRVVAVVSWSLIAILIVTMTPFISQSGGASYAADKPKGNWIHYAAKSFAGGNGTKKKPFIIKTAAQLAYLAKRVEASHAKASNYTKFRYYKLDNDIDLSKHYWTPIGRSDGNVYNTLLYGKAFRGAFDGGGHTIRGLRITGNVEYAGLFGVSGEIVIRDDKGAKQELGFTAYNPEVAEHTTSEILKKESERVDTVIKNLRLKNVQIKTSGFAGAICGYAVWMLVLRCESQGNVFGQKGAGGIIAKGFEVSTKYMTVKGKVQSKGQAGGVISSFVISLMGSGCPNNTVNVDVKGGTNVGGIVGLYRSGGGNPFGFYPATKTAHVNVSGTSNVGGIVGCFEDQYEYDFSEPVDRIVPTSLKNLKVKGTVRGKKNVGGIAGYEVGQNIKDCTFTGKVIGKENTGGLIGYKKSGRANSGTISQSFVQAKVTGGKNTGGFIGMIENDFNVNIDKSYVTGTLKGTENLGGAIGYARLNNTIFRFTESYITGSLKGKINTGGLIGAADEDRIRHAELSRAWVSTSLTGQAATKGTLFGKKLMNFHTKIGTFYFDKTRAKTQTTGIEVYPGSPGSFRTPKAVTTGDLQRRKLAGLSGKVWQKTKPKGKVGWLPQLRVFSSHKQPEVKKASLTSTKTAAWYKVTYSGNGGKTAAGKKTATQFVRYSQLKKAAPPAFLRAGYLYQAIAPWKPKKLPKYLKGDQTKVRLKWVKAASLTPKDVTFLVIRESDETVKVDWNYVKNASGYCIYMAETGSGIWEKAATISNPKTLTCMIKGLEWNKRYAFKVTAWRKYRAATLESRNSEICEVKIQKPPRQTGVSARNLTDGRVELTLNPGNNHGYQIRQAPAQTGNYTQICDIPASWFTGQEPTYTINQADTGRPCDYQVIAWRYANGTSGTKLYGEPSDPVSATARPPKAIIVKAEAVTGPAIKLSIKNLFCTGYDIYRAQGSPENFVKIKTIELNGTGDSRQENEGGPDGNDFAVWEDTSAVSATFYYKVVPYAGGYGVKAEGLPSDIVEVAAP